MKQLKKLISQIASRINTVLLEHGFDAELYVRECISWNKLNKFYAFYGITSFHPLGLYFRHSNLAGSYFLGKCSVENSVLYKSDIRGDELKAKGEIFHNSGTDIVVYDDEVIRIKGSFLIKTLVHNFSHNPDNLEEFLILSTLSMHYANIHGSPVEGSFLGPFSTVDLTSLHNCLVRAYAYLQAGEMSDKLIEPGQIQVSNGDIFDFSYRFPSKDLNDYIDFKPGENPRGIFIDFIESREKDFQNLFDVVCLKTSGKIPDSASVNRYAVIKGEIYIGENVLVAQRAYLENAWLGNGANAQENCYIIDSRLAGNNVTAHGAKIIHAQLGNKVFVGFNSFLRGKADCSLTVGEETIIMPHTIIDLKEPLDIPSGYLVWGLIKKQSDLKKHSISLAELSMINGKLTRGLMHFKGSGFDFVQTFQDRIEHILAANGAYFDGSKNKGHAQKGRDISFNIIQPYPCGPLEGFYPTISIRS